MRPIAPVPSGSSILVWVAKTRLLGLTADQKLSWVPQVMENQKGKLKISRKGRMEIILF